MFIIVIIDNLKELSRSIPEIVKREDKINKDNIKIITEIKYLFISLISTVELENSSLFIYILYGLTFDTNSLIANLKSEYNFTNLIPELVEKKDPPIITIIKKKNEAFS